MKIRMDIPDSIYLRYKELAEKQGFAITKLNSILFEEALENWIFKALAEDKSKCVYCGDIINKNSGHYLVAKTDNEDFNLWNKFFVCEACYDKEIRLKPPAP